MSLYAEYVKLEEKYEIVETENGFFTYQRTDQELYIADFYVRPGNTNEAYRLWERMREVAKESGCPRISCVVWHDATRPNYTTKKVKTFMGHGFKVYKVEKNTIVLIREV